MRKTLTRLLVAALAASSLMSFGAPSSHAEELVDLTVDISGPAEISPAGERGTYTAVVRNVGTLPTSSAVLTFDLAVGSDFVSASPGCASADGVDGDVTCSVGPLAGSLNGPAGSQVFSFTANTPIEEGSISTKAVVTSVHAIDTNIEPVDELIGVEYDENNEASTSTVLSNGDYQGFLPENGQLTLTLADGRSFSLQVPSDGDASTTKGVIVKRLEPSEATNVAYQCLTLTNLSGCTGKGFVIDFVQHEEYSWLDNTNPLRGTLVTGTVDPCRGYGGGCFPPLWTADNSNDQILRRAPYCAGAAPGNAAPGSGVMVAKKINGEYDVCTNDEYKIGASFGYSTRLLSVDPPLIPSLG